MYIEFYDFSLKSAYEVNCYNAEGRLEINDNIDISNPDQYIHERDNDGDARFSSWYFWLVDWLSICY